MQMLLVVVLAALVVTVWWLAGRVRAAERRIGELALLRREIEEVKDDATRDLAATRAHLAAVAAGRPPAAESILRGVPFADVAPADALALYAETPDLFVLDVRTAAEYASGHIPRARLLPVDQLEERLGELPPRDTPMLVTCAAGGRSVAACRTLAERGYTRLMNLVGGMQSWPGPRVHEERPPAAPDGATPAISFRGGAVSESQVIAAIRECYDPEIPLNVYDLGLIYDVDIEPAAIAVKMTLTSEACPSAKTIPDEVKRRIAALGQPNVSVDVVWDPPWHPSRISAEGKQKLGLA